jgi:L-alanine-DL-glutamate epimerase-like enolase superfamily enzyme
VSADGRITQSDAPGIGYDVKEELLEKLTVRTEAFSA